MTWVELHSCGSDRNASIVHNRTRHHLASESHSKSHAASGTQFSSSWTQRDLVRDDRGMQNMYKVNETRNCGDRPVKDRTMRTWMSEFFSFSTMPEMMKVIVDVVGFVV